MVYHPNKYQAKIYDFVRNGTGNAIVEAVAGSGKTTVIVNATTLIPRKKKIAFLCFNKSISNELKTRLPKHVRVSTLHSVGKSLFYRNRIDSIVDKKKLYRIIKHTLEDFKDHYEKRELEDFLSDVIPKVKQTMCGTDKESLQSLPSYYASSITDDRAKLVDIVLNECLETDTIDFDDMIWLPVVKNFDAPKYDWLLIDEAQDLSKTQFELIKMLCNDHTRIVAVGDSKQAIYLFRCADSSSMRNFKEYFNATEFPLSICYRCPKKVIERAQTIVPQIEASQDATDGVVDTLSKDEMIDKAQDGDLILCRTNAPLIEITFSLIRQGKKAIIKGRNDVGKYLLSNIESYRTSTLSTLIWAVTKKRSALDELLMRMAEKKVYNPKLKQRTFQSIDICDTILALATESVNITDLKDKVNSIFSTTTTGITCSTIHKVKGLENDRVFIYRYDLMPHPMAETNEELQEERNIEYVAITRAKKELYFIDEN